MASQGFVEGLSEAEWRLPVSSTRQGARSAPSSTMWPAVYPIEIDLARAIGGGNAVTA